MHSTSEFNVGLLGLGTVGAGLARLLLQKRDWIAAQIGCPVNLTKVLVQDPAKARPVDLPPGSLTTDPAAVLDDPSIDLVVEALGGEEPAREYVFRAIRNHKHVVTPNKMLIAKHGREIHRLAAEHNVDVHYEASVGGGIPLIAAFKQDLVANEIRQIRAIINGTTNYMLTRMAAEGLAYGDVLADAQRLGYAEPDPRDDVEGNDAAYKLTILASLAFHIALRPEEIYREGITKLTPQDFSYARQMGYAIKLLAIGRAAGEQVELRVQPTLVPETALIAQVNGPFNAVEVDGDLTGKVIFYGRGAGPEPTASALIADIIDIAQDVRRWEGDQAPRLLIDERRSLLPIERSRSGYYLRLSTRDEPGVLAHVTTALADQQISIASIVQRTGASASLAATHLPPPPDGQAEIVIVTHDASEASIRAAVERLRGLPETIAVAPPLRVETE